MDANVNTKVENEERNFGWNWKRKRNDKLRKKKIWHKQTTKLQQIEDCETHIVTAWEKPL